MRNIKKFFLRELFPYDRNKVAFWKAVLPFGIIIHHLSNRGLPGIECFKAVDDFIMPIFFAMSGFGLYVSYKQRESYLQKFLSKSLKKLFFPYFVVLVLIVLYRQFHGVDQIGLLVEKGLLSFVPASWYIFVLSLFYIFFYFVFKYIRGSDFCKVCLVCCLVMAYYFVAPHIGVEFWRYQRCPAFCMGLIVALFNEKILHHFKCWHILVLGSVLCAFKLKFTAFFMNPILYPILFFSAMYVIRNIREMFVVKKLSSISLELYIVQCIPIRVVMEDLGVSNTLAAVALVLLFDIVLAILVHIFVLKTSKKMGSA